MEEPSIVSAYDSPPWNATEVVSDGVPDSIFTTFTSSPWDDSVAEFGNITTLLSNSSSKNRTTRNSSVSVFYPIIVAEMVLSIICLILSIIVYSILPEFKNVHGKNLISLSACLLTTFLLLCIDIKLRLVISYSFCFIVAVVTHVTFLATFFWTNVMAFDIWNNITSIKSKREVRSHSKRYFRYSIYAWTATILASLPAIIMELTDIVPSEYKPHFGVRRCWLSGKTAFIFYFNLPVGIILFGNLIMFIMTIWRLHQIKKTTAILQVKQQQKRLNLYLKLFFVMGIIWTTEFLPWATKIYKLYALAGIMTALHGVLLFAIFVLKKKILRQIRDLLTGKTSLAKFYASNQTSCSSAIQSVITQSDSKA